LKSGKQTHQDLFITAQMQNKLHISEIFYSIQGESTFAGLPCIFIRLSGCNLRCNYCDAEYTWEKGDSLSISELLSTIQKYPCTLVEVTGGEPLQQAQSQELLRVLLKEDYNILLETNGSFSIEPVHDKITAIIDVKCPDSGSTDSFHMDNINEIKRRISVHPGSCELKFVLSSKKDFLWATNFIKEHSLNALLPVLFSPVQGRVSPQELAEWIMETNLAIRLQLQLHTILWPDKTRGI
jgi:7-carboxy-7-deazaguanine synthase